VARYLICNFCGKDLAYEGESADEAVLKRAVDHEKSCPKNPYKKKIEALRDALIDLEIQYRHVMGVDKFTEKAQKAIDKALGY
jgi:hypothetical protein